MAYDKELEQRIADILQSWQGITAKKMFGGVGYLFKGNMCFGIHKEYLILRLGEQEARNALKLPYARPFDITGRPMKGWVMMSPAMLQDQTELEQWLLKAMAFCKTLPPK